MAFRCESMALRCKSTALGCESTALALGCESTTLGCEFTALGCESTDLALGCESTALGCESTALGCFKSPTLKSPSIHSVYSLALAAPTGRSETGEGADSSGPAAAAEAHRGVWALSSHKQAPAVERCDPFTRNLAQFRLKMCSFAPS
eukprot:898138-Prorocentrum_minimum.AAC.1